MECGYVTKPLKSLNSKSGVTKSEFSRHVRRHDRLAARYRVFKTAIEERLSAMESKRR